jgi:hypothetical protein
MVTSSSHTKRIFVVEQSARGVGGHHLEYAIRIAESSGVSEKLIVVSKKFEFLDQMNYIDILPSYKYGYWDLPGKDFIRFLQKFLKNKNSFFYTPLKIPKCLLKCAYLFSTIRQPEVFFSIFQKESSWPPKISISKILIILISSILFAPVVILISMIKFIFWNISMRIIRKIVRKASLVSKRIVSYILKIAILLSFSKKRNQFIKDTNLLFKNNRISDGDLIFFGTISLAELSGLNEILQSIKNKPKCLVILRREPNEFGEKAWNWQQIAKQSHSSSVRFYADTVELSKVYSFLFGFRVGVFPIPAGKFVPDELSAIHDYEITYMGDARTEKGFEDFSEVVRDKPALNVFAQVNHAPHIDSGLAIAIQTVLKSNAFTAVTPMDSSTYLETISKSDLLWIGYLGENYEKRSSGIFVEATVRGIPSLVTNNSWMHAEIYRNSESYWQESLKSINNQWLGQRRGIIKVLTSSNKNISVIFELSSGIKLISSGWADKDGVAYIVLPFLHKTENFIKVEELDSFTDLNVIGFSDMKQKPLWIGGIVLNNPKRTNLAISEFQSLKSSYANFRDEIRAFTDFHSDSKIKSVLEEYQR